MEITSTQKHVHTSARKLRLVADMIRGMEPSRALQTLRFTNKAAALPISKVIKTAIANAMVQGLSADQLTFKRLEVNQGIDMKRVRSAGRGRTRPYAKRTSHVFVVLTNEPVVKKEAKNAKQGGSTK